MKAKTYNISLLTGIGLIGGGIGMVNIPAALVSVGALVISLTLFGAYMSGRKV